MLKKLGIPTLAVLGVLALAGAAPAKAGVHFGIGIGGPVYAAPYAPYAAPYDPYAYNPYAYDPYAYGYPDYYYSAPVVPYGGFYYGGHWGDHDRGHFEGRGHYEGGNFGGGGHFAGHAGGGHGRR